MKRRFWVPIRTSYSEYMGNKYTRDRNYDLFACECIAYDKLATDVTEPGTFLMFREGIQKELEKIADEETECNQFIGRALALIGDRLAATKLSLTEGESMSLGIILGEFVVAYAMAEKFKKVFGSFDPKGGNE